ncbi:TolC family protein [Cyclobacterium sp.]|uniref:TolC family protein n=1 Tax=Cyclobacterium sp. TaxID=1966343 RepID=UPI0019BF3DF3|nr:TolC family protein [Cyclobacterium sp.]MBD3631300.1 TolC family protein [Cyclobacterium sp.]
MESINKKRIASFLPYGCVQHFLLAGEHSSRITYSRKADFRTGIILAVFLCLTIFQQTHAQEKDTLALTLKETLSSALTGNPEILLAKLEIQRTTSQLKAAKGALLPYISIDGQYLRNIKRPVFFLPPGEGFGGAGGGSEGTIIEAGFDNSYNISAQANLPLYNRELRTSKRAAETAVEIQEKGLDINKNQIRTQVKQAYYEALLARESLQVLDQSLENAQRNFENIQNQFSQELVPEYDMIRAEVQVENIRPDILQGQNSYEAAVNNLKLLANIPQEIPVSLEESLVEFYENSDPEVILSGYTLEDNPELQQLAVQQNLRKKQIEVQKAAFYPSLSAIGNYAWQAQANNFNFNNYFWVNTSFIGIQLSIPVFQGLTRVRQIEQARIDLYQTNIQEEYQRKSLSIQAQNALNRIQRAQRSLEAQEKNIAQAERGYQIAQVSYNSGVGTLIEVNDAELALTQARLNQLEIIYEYLIALADFNQLTGNETND